MEDELSSGETPLIEKIAAKTCSGSFLNVQVWARVTRTLKFIAIRWKVAQMLGGRSGVFHPRGWKAHLPSDSG